MREIEKEEKAESGVCLLVVAAMYHINSNSNSSYSNSNSNSNSISNSNSNSE